jgi:beta-aspartyl-peptidase (threonine type)
VAGKVVLVGSWSLGRPALIVHGGAGGWRGVSSEEEVVEAVRRGAEALSDDSGALQLVVEAVRRLEDSGVLNAGIGSVLTIDGRVEMDAGLMTGDMVAGGVAAVTYPRNPILLARWVAEETPHVLLAGPAADEAAKRLGLPRHPGPSRRALERWERLMKLLQEGRLDEVPERVRRVYRLLYGGDTVGAVALALDGSLAAAASTGGVGFKHPGRVGDSPIPGAGFYAENGVGGCAATGIGETIILGRPCLHAVELMRQGVPAAEAAVAAVARHTRLFGPDNLGLIVLSADGEAAAAMNTEAMPVAVAGSGGVIAFLARRGGAEK